MVVEARDLPSARLKRWGSLAAGAMLAAACLAWAVHDMRDARRTGRSLAEWEQRLSDHEARADEVARECNIPYFSDEAALEHFPMEVRPFPTKQEKKCVQEVGEARADLIDDYLKLHDLRPAMPELRAAWHRSAIVATLVIAAWLAALYVLEIRPRRSGA